MPATICASQKDISANKADQISCDWRFDKGQWELQQGTLRQVSGQGAPAVLRYLKGTDWNNLLIMTRVHLPPGGVGGIVFRSTDQHKYLVAYINNLSRMVEVWRFVGPQNRTMIFSSGIPEIKASRPDGTTPYEISIQSHWDQFQLVVNEHPIASFSVNEQNHGSIGFWTWASPATFERISVERQYSLGMTFLHFQKALVFTLGALLVYMLFSAKGVILSGVLAILSLIVLMLTSLNELQSPTAKWSELAGDYSFALLLVLLAIQIANAFGLQEKTQHWISRLRSKGQD